MLAATRSLRLSQIIANRSIAAAKDPNIDPTTKQLIIDSFIGTDAKGKTILQYICRPTIIPLVLRTINELAGPDMIWSILDHQYKGINYMTLAIRNGFMTDEVKVLVQFGCTWSISAETIFRNRGSENWREIVIALDPSIDLNKNSPNNYKVPPEKIHALRQEMYFSHSLTSLLLYAC